MVEVPPFSGQPRDGPVTTRFRCPACEAWDWCDIRLLSEHGDPYVFPTGVVEEQDLTVELLEDPVVR